MVTELIEPFFWRSYRSFSDNCMMAPQLILLSD